MKTYTRDNLVVTLDDEGKPIIAAISQLHPKIRRATVRGHFKGQGYTRKIAHLRHATQAESARFTQGTTADNTAVYCEDLAWSTQEVFDLTEALDGTFTVDG